LFGGRTWKVEDIDEEQKTIFVSRSPGGSPPLFSGGAGKTHTRVRERMRDLLESEEVPKYLDETAKRSLRQGREGYASRGRAQNCVLELGAELLLMTWQGDATNEALASLLRMRGYAATAAG